MRIFNELAFEKKSESNPARERTETLQLKKVEKWISQVFISVDIENNTNAEFVKSTCIEPDSRDELWE